MLEAPILGDDEDLISKATTSSTGAPTWRRAVERVAARYARDYKYTPARRGHFHYVRMKLIADPVARMITDLECVREAALGDVLDVGTGRGQLPILLLELGCARSVRALDWDRAKIEAASLAGAGSKDTPGLQATFEVGDARDAELPRSDTVLLIDVLHYLTIAEQDDLLLRAARAVRAGGRIIVREADSELGWRSGITLLEELLFTALRFNRGARVRFRDVREIVARLEAEGFACEVRPAWGRMPLSNMLIIGRRDPDRAAASHSEQRR